MTTQTTTIQPSTKGMRALIGATAASLVMLGGALLWQVRPTSETTVPTTTTSISGAVNEGVKPLGGLAEQYRDEQQAGAAASAARVTTLGGLAELYAEEQAAARAEVTRLERMGGMAELYRDQAQPAASAQ